MESEGRDIRFTVSFKPRAPALRVLATKENAVADLDPLRLLPCDHARVQVHTTNGEDLGYDMVECESCGYVVTLRDLYHGLFPGG